MVFKESNKKGDQVFGTVTCIIALVFVQGSIS